jgi:hypothetical protein
MMEIVIVSTKKTSNIKTKANKITIIKLITTSILMLIKVEIQILEIQEIQSEN